MKVVNVTLEGKLSDFLIAYNDLDETARVHVMQLQRAGKELDDTIALSMSSTRASRVLDAVPQFIHVPSGSRSNLDHTVTVVHGVPLSCTCENYTYGRTDRCKHMVAAQHYQIETKAANK